MSHKEQPVPPMSDALRAAVRERSSPVKPLLPPGPRAALLTATGILVALAFVAATGVRADAAALGMPIVWVPALVRLAAAGAWMLLIAREATPSEGVSAPVRIAAFVSVPALLLVSAFVVARAGGNGAGLTPMMCYGKVVALAIPAMGAALWLLRRAFPLRPILAYLGAGLAAGLIAETALHLTCPSTSPAHMLLIHGGAVATAAAFGAVMGAGRLRRGAR
ncbi:MAG TPA: NrsF family protein [Candidatus Polarisedimenticolaceae bacterium]|nr:NrsF family protein [Candidatus Polarisedimenticolaceae bacterium]